MGYFRLQKCRISCPKLVWVVSYRFVTSMEQNWWKNAFFYIKRRRSSRRRRRIVVSTLFHASPSHERSPCKISWKNSIGKLVKTTFTFFMDKICWLTFSTADFRGLTNPNSKKNDATPQDLTRSYLPKHQQNYWLNDPFRPPWISNCLGYVTNFHSFDSWDWLLNR